MTPTLQVGDVFTVELNHDPAVPERYDVIVSRLPSDPSTDSTERPASLQSDRVAMRAGVLVLSSTAILNDTPVPRRPTDPIPVRDGHSADAQAQGYTEAMPNGRSNANVKLADTGSYNDGVETNVPSGTVFVLGDNRYNGLDGRVADQQRPMSFGPIPINNLVGSAAAICQTNDRKRVGTRLELRQMPYAATRNRAPSSAWPKSARMSSMCSMPTLSRMYPGLTPVAICSSAASWLCVVLAGWMASVRLSPMLAT